MAEAAASSAAPASGMSEFMEAVARNGSGTLPDGYGYEADVALRVGFYRYAKNGVKVLEKPVRIPSGDSNIQGYMIFYAYCSKDGMVSLLEGGMPPQLPCTVKEPSAFESLEAIADNFGNKDPKSAKANSEYSAVFRVPAQLATQVDTPDRDIWIVRFDQDYVSPYLQHVKEGEVEKATKFLDEGAVKASCVDEEGVSGLMMAAMAGNVAMCEMLINRRAQINWVEPINSRTPLMFAAQGGFTSIVDLMLKSGADIMKQDSEGQSALMWAALGGKTETAKLLKAQGGPELLALKNTGGTTALDVAKVVGHTETVAVIEG